MRLVEFVKSISPNNRDLAREQYKLLHKWPLAHVLYVLKREGQKAPVIVNTPIWRVR